ncbi:MAG: hypothetical protein VYC42_07945 [Pseudomonadota bacterium]|nr:hypothetical protein [Pseudomonadota bacterium]
MKTATCTALNILAAGIFIAGLLSPLTPSEGMPSLGHLLLFALLPAALLLYAGYVAGGVSGWSFFGIQAAAVATSVAWLLSLQAGLLASGSIYAVTANQALQPTHLPSGLRPSGKSAAELGRWASQNGTGVLNNWG